MNQLPKKRVCAREWAAGAATTAEFQSVFARLRQILQKHSGVLQVTADAPDHYCLYLPNSPKLKKGLPVAWVKINKTYVSYHFMPAYGPAVRDGLSKQLQARMQGKTCFNFKVADEALFNELDEMTTQGFARWKKAGFGPASQAPAPTPSAAIRTRRSC